jgi:hypothetical protein
VPPREDKPREIMNEVEMITLIKTTLTRRGDGTANSPVRIITQYWLQDGSCLIEYDPIEDTCIADKKLIA